MPRRVSALEAAALLANEGYLQLDVRSVAEFEAGHPAGAFNIPWVHMDGRGRVPNAEFADVVERTFPDKAARLVLSCQSGNRSLQALLALEARGYTHIVDQQAGWGGVRDPFGQLTEKGWQAEGLPAETGAGGERSYATLAQALTGTGE